MHGFYCVNKLLCGWMHYKYISMFAGLINGLYFSQHKSENSAKVCRVYYFFHPYFQQKSSYFAKAAKENRYNCILNSEFIEITYLSKEDDNGLLQQNQYMCARKSIEKSGKINLWFLFHIKNMVYSWISFSLISMTIFWVKFLFGL